MSKKVVSTPSAPAAIGPYNQATIGAGLVHCSGQIAIDPATGELVAGGVEEQAERALTNLQAVLEAAGTDLARVLRCTVYLTDMADFVAVNAVYARFFEGSEPPARATVAVVGLPKGARFEIDCVALA